MTRRGYVPLAIEETPFVFAAHLPGITADVDGFTIGDVRISKLTFDECYLLEKSHFMDDLKDNFYAGREPFFIIFCDYPADDADTERITNEAIVSIWRLTRALRLLKGGEIFDPSEFIVYTKTTEGGRAFQKRRDPRMFGRLAFRLAESPHVSLSVREIEDLDGLYSALALFDRCRYDLAVSRADALLAASFSPAHTSIHHRTLPLLGAIEILAGHDVTPLLRAAWATAEVKRWVTTFRSFRNILAHGARDAPEQLDTTRFIVRALLREAVAWRLAEPERESVTGTPLLERACAAEAAEPARLATLTMTYPSIPRVWDALALSARSFKMSPDSNFTAKMEDVVGLYMGERDKALALSIDEKLQIQALDRAESGLLTEQARPGTITHDDKHNEILKLLAELNLLDGFVDDDDDLESRKSAQKFLSFLKEIEKQTSADLDLHLIVDNFSPHKAAAVKRWLERHARFHLHFTPTSSTWLHTVFFIFNETTSNRIRSGVFVSVEELNNAIMDYVSKGKGGDFVWTKSAAQLGPVAPRPAWPAS